MALEAWALAMAVTVVDIHMPVSVYAVMVDSGPVASFEELKLLISLNLFLMRSCIFLDHP